MERGCVVSKPGPNADPVRAVSKDEKKKKEIKIEKMRQRMLLKCNGFIAKGTTVAHEAVNVQGLRALANQTD